MTKNSIRWMALALAPGFLVAGCSSGRYADSESRHGHMSQADQNHRMHWSQQEQVSQEAAGAERGAQDQNQDQKQWVIPLYQEQINVGKRTVDSGQVTIRKVIQTETFNQPVELRRETLVIEREAAGATRNNDQPALREGGADGNAFQEQTFTIRLQEEQPVVSKQVLTKGRIIARRGSEMQKQTVQQEYRVEDVRVDRTGSANNVQLRGDFATGEVKEAAGAEPRATDKNQLRNRLNGGWEKGQKYED